MINKVTLNLPAYPTGDLPNPDQPIITIDGTSIKHLTRIALELDADNDCGKLTLEFHATVDGQILIEGDNFVKERLIYSAKEPNKE